MQLRELKPSEWPNFFDCFSRRPESEIGSRLDIPPISG
jgi:hypothetical protein